MLNVNEIFYTIQGEGPFTGKPAIFVRLSGCNLRCVWCDTMYTWLYSESLADKIRENVDIKTDLQLKVYNKEDETHPMNTEQIMNEIIKYNGKHIVISGGEPLLQALSLKELITKLHNQGYSIEIETNGTISPKDIPDPVRFNVSPKLENSYNNRKRRYKPNILQEFSLRDTIFKFVASTKSDLIEINQIIDDIDIDPTKVYLMPEGRTSEELSKKSSWLINACKENNFNYTHRLHIDLFDKTRGV